MQGVPLTTQQKQKFLQKYLSTAGNASKAAKAAGISRSAAYLHRDNDADFRQAWDNAEAQVVDAMEEELHRRSTKGYLEPVFYKGEMVAKVRKYSDSLLQFALKGKKPDVYRERFEVNQNVTGSLDVNIQSTINQVYGESDDSQPEATASTDINAGPDQDS